MFTLGGYFKGVWKGKKGTKIKKKTPVETRKTK